MGNILNTENDYFKEERRSKIMHQLTADGRIRVADLATSLAVSDATVRRDLEAMQHQGLLIRTHGGAMLPQMAAFEVSFDESRTRALSEKQAIGFLAAQQVREGETIIIESGSTTLEMARCLGEFKQLTVMTNSLAICKELSNNPGIEILVLGGSLRRQSASLVGKWVVDILENVRVDVAFLGANGISANFGISAPNVYTAETRKAMMNSAHRRIALADHSKLGVEALYRVAPVDELSMLVTDSFATTEQISPICAAHVEILIAK